MGYWKSKPPPGVQVNRGIAKQMGLVGAWLFNEKSGSVVDVVGKISGTLIGDASMATSPRGSLLQLGGSTSRVAVTASAVLDCPNGYTVEAWINPSVLTGTQSIISCWDATANFGQYQLEINRTAGKFGCISGRASSYFLQSGSQSLTANTLQHVAAACTFVSGTTFSTQYYLNGVPDPSGPYVNAFVGAFYNLHIGVTSGDTSQRFVGGIDSIYVFNRPSTNDEIRRRISDPYGFMQDPTWRRFYSIPANVSVGWLRQHAIYGGFLGQGTG